MVQDKPNAREENTLVPFQYEVENPFDDALKFNLMQNASEVQNNKIIAVSQKQSTKDTTMEKQIVKKTSPKIPMMFQGCTINGNVTINLPK